MNVNRGKMTAAAVLAVTLLVVGGVTGYGLHRAGTVGQPFVEDGRQHCSESDYRVCFSCHNSPLIVKNLPLFRIVHCYRSDTLF